MVSSGFYDHETAPAGEDIFIEATLPAYSAMVDVRASIEAIGAGIVPILVVLCEPEASSYGYSVLSDRILTGNTPWDLSSPQVQYMEAVNSSTFQKHFTIYPYDVYAAFFFAGPVAGFSPGRSRIDLFYRSLGETPRTQWS